MYRLVQQHAASFIANTEASTGSELPRFIKEEFDAFLECGILAHGFLGLQCGDCGHDKLLAAQPELVTPVLRVVQRVITRHLLDDAQLPADEGHGGAVATRTHERHSAPTAWAVTPPPESVRRPH